MPSGFHTSAVYGAVGRPAEAHEKLMPRLNVKLMERTATRTR